MTENEGEFFLTLSLRFTLIFHCYTYILQIFFYFVISNLKKKDLE